MKKLKGIIPPIGTPLDENHRVDEGAMRSLVNYCIDKKFHGIFVCGSNGEVMALRQKERERAIAIAIDEAKGRIPILAGCMDSSAERVIDNIKAVEQMGEAIAVVSPLVYTAHTGPKEFIRLFEQLSLHTNSELMMYNIPPYTGYEIPKEAVFEIATFDRVIGYKDTSGNMPAFLSCLEHFRGTDFLIFQGKLPLSAISMVAGADGFIPNLGPVAPEISHKIYEYGAAGDMEKAMAYQELLTKLLGSVQKGNAIAGCKMAYHLRGLTSPIVCEPALPVTPSEKEGIVQTLQMIDAAAANMAF